MPICKNSNFLKNLFDFFELIGVHSQFEIHCVNFLFHVVVVKFDT